MSRVLLCMSGPDHAPILRVADDYDSAVLDARYAWGVYEGPLGPVDRYGREVVREWFEDGEREIWTVSDGLQHWAAFFYWGDL